MIRIILTDAEKECIEKVDAFWVNVVSVDVIHVADYIVKRHLRLGFCIQKHESC